MLTVQLGRCRFQWACWYSAVSTSGLAARPSALPGMWEAWENLGEAHRKHAFQLMANELGMSHVAVSCIYMVLQLAISLVMVYLVPDTALAHWIYLIAVGIILAGAYVVFMRKYYHLHEEYLDSLNKVKN